SSSRTTCGTAWPWRCSNSSWCALWRSARLPPTIPHRGAHAADRARGRSRWQHPSRAGRRRGAEVREAGSRGNALHLASSELTRAQLLNDDLRPKRLELLNALVPNLSKVALLREDVTTSALPQVPARYGQEVAIAARGLGIEVHTFIVRRAGDLAAAFLGMKKNHDQGVVVMSPAFMFVHRKAVIDLAATHRIPAIYELRVVVAPGGLMSYGVNVSEMQRRAAVYVDKILKGAKPSDLPVEQPTTFEFVVNLKTAKALALTIPQTLLIRADQVIE